MVDSPFPLMRWSRWAILLVGAVCFAPVSVAQSHPAKESHTAAPPQAHKTTTAAHPNIVLITLDTTRADRLGFLGSKLGLTPNLDQLAKQGIVFTHAYSHVPLTTASHATILTGTYPQFNHVNDFGVPLAARLPYLPDVLHAHGYHTGAFVGSLVLDPLQGTAPGFDRGFDVYDAGFRLRPHGGQRYQTVERRGGEVVDRALAWLSHNSKGPFFLWVHLYDAHDPYDPPSPFKERFAAHPYDGEIAYADSAVGKLLTQLRAHGLYDGAVIAIMADHGESLGEHGEKTHGIFLYDETIHVPLLFKMPGERYGGKGVDAQASLVDVMPTVLQAAGIPVPGDVQGHSLLMEMKPPPPGAKPPEERLAYAETDYPHRAFGWSSLRALRSGKYAFIQAPQAELYDRATDPGQLHNLAERSKAVADTLSLQLTQFRKRTGQSLKELAALTPDQEAKLAALGYVASDASKIGAGNDTGPDPKGRIETANLLHDAMLDVENNSFQEAVPLLQRVLKDQPNMAVATMQLGVAQAGLKNYADAVDPLRKAVKLLPDSGMGHYQLGLALYETGDWKGAAPEFEAAVTLAPRWADAHFSLASVWARIDRVPDAMEQLRITLELDPNHYRANLLRGRILSLQGDAAAALPNLQKAVEVQPGSKEAHLFLADAYEQLGRPLDAGHERDMAQRITPSPHP